MKHFTKAYLEKDEAGDYVAVASTEVEDRQGEVVEVSGWDLKNFKKNPVLLLFHDHHSLPVGKATKIWVEKSAKPKLMFKPEFETITERGKAIAELVKNGFLKTFSVGFRPLDSDENRFTKQELLEISLVNVPANPEAMMLAYKSLRDSGFKSKTLEEIGIPAAVFERFEEIEQRLQRVEGKTEAAVQGLKHLNPHIGRNKRIATERQAMHKIIARATDSLIKGRHDDAIQLLKVVKRANEMLTVSNKGDINNG